MIAPLEHNLDAIRDLCHEYRVARLEVFGSATRDDFDAAKSDLDFLVTFAPLSPGERTDAYFGLLFALENLFEHPVDLLEAGAVKNPYVKRMIESHKQPLYLENGWIDEATQCR